MCYNIPKAEAISYTNRPPIHMVLFPITFLLRYHNGNKHIMSLHQHVIKYLYLFKKVYVNRVWEIS